MQRGRISTGDDAGPAFGQGTTERDQRGTAHQQGGDGGHAGLVVSIALRRSPAACPSARRIRPPRRPPARPPRPDGHQRAHHLAGPLQHPSRVLVAQQIERLGQGYATGRR